MHLQRFFCTPLHLAASRGHAECVRLLVAAGADLEATEEARGYGYGHIDTTNSHNPTPQQRWRLCGFIPQTRKARFAVSALLAQDGETPLIVAAGAAMAECVATLLALGARRDATDKARAWMGKYHRHSE